MKKYLLYIVFFVLTTFVFLELTVRLFSLSGHTIPYESINNNFLLKPGSNGIWVKGGLGEIRSHYSVNSQGFNSVKDFSELSKNKLKVAIIGDSFIEGLHTNVENSIGRLLEDMMLDSIEVIEYGRSGANIVDFYLIYQQFVKGKFDYVFVHIEDLDLVDQEPKFMQKSIESPHPTIFRKIYNNVHLLRYLNINHNLSVKFKKIYHSRFGTPMEKYIANYSFRLINYESMINYSVISDFDSTVIFLYEKGKLDTSIVKFTKHSLVEIKHKRMPNNHGFDRHWNLNGRMNCAETIKAYIEQPK